jgi:predicted Zn-dependent peptidase
MYRVTRLPNGLTVATAEMPHMASVSVGLWVGTGGRYEPPELNGVSHFIEHVLFKGTRRRTARQISQDVEGIGGYLNAFTAEENTCYYSKSRHDRYKDLLDVLMDMYLESTFDPVEIGKEREVITRWPGHPLGRPITGTNQTLDGLKRAELVGYLGKNYVASNTLVAMAGCIRHEQAVKAVVPYARRMTQGRRPMFLPAGNGQKAPRIRLHSRATEQAQLAIGIRACSRHDEQRFAVRVLNAILGENMSSRLFQLLREDLGLAYSVYSSAGFFDDTGSITISAGVDTAKLGRTLKLIMAELAKLRDAAPPAAELRRARDYLIGQLDLHLEGTENQMMWVGENLLAFGKVIPAADVRQRLHAVTVGQVRAAARAYFRPERYSLALVSPLRTDRGLARTLGGRHP